MRPPPSTTGTWSMRAARMTLAASPTRSSGWMVRGWRPMALETGRVKSV